MDKKEILAFINKNPMGNLATVEGSQPRVRGMETFRADEKGIILYSHKSKDVYKQIAKNPAVEINYVAEGDQVRVSGRMEIVEDMAIKKEIVAARPFLKPIVEQTGYENMAVFRLAKGKATTWSMKDMAAPKTFVEL